MREFGSYLDFEKVGEVGKIRQRRYKKRRKRGRKMLSELVFRTARLQIHEARDILQRLDKDLKAIQRNLKEEDPEDIGEAASKIMYTSALLEDLGWQLNNVRDKYYEED